MKKSVWIVLIAMGLMLMIVAGFTFLDVAREKKSVAEWEETEPIVEKREIVYTKTEIVSDGINSYWFVYAKERSKSVYWNEMVKFEHSYFSMREAFELMNKTSGKETKIEFFLMNFYEVSEATYIDYHNPPNKE